MHKSIQVEAFAQKLSSRQASLSRRKSSVMSKDLVKDRESKPKFIEKVQPDFESKSGKL